jgi:acetolactate synthase-1/2/3 large subunit
MLTVVLDNGGWAAVKEATSRVYPDGHARQSKAFEATLEHGCDFALMCRAGGGHGETVESADQLDAAIARSLAAVGRGLPALIHAHIPAL